MAKQGLAHALGSPLPDTLHAVSVSMPTWQDVVDYEEGKPHITQCFRAGYPRFFFHPLTAQLFDRCTKAYAKEGERCMVLPSLAVAAKAAAFIKEQTGNTIEYAQIEQGPLAYIKIKQELFPTAKAFWQHSGFVISSRIAETALAGEKVMYTAEKAKPLQAHIAEWTGVDAEDVFLFPSGMAAIFTAHQMLTHNKSDAKTVQLGFPYVDTLKIQQKWGKGVHFLPHANVDETLKVLETLATKEPIAAVFTEFPTNPLLHSANLLSLSLALKRCNVPLVIDETIGGYANIDVLPYTDVLVTSLTKFVSGEGDVLGGALILHKHSPFYAASKAWLNAHYQYLVCDRDMEILVENAKNYLGRIATINRNTELVCEMLKDHPLVKKVYYPLFTDRDNYERVKKLAGGYGGLFSITLKDPEKAPAFYDALQVSKGPSLGTIFTLACPYTLLAHYQELEFARESGVPADLIRVSIGIEPINELIAIFKEALSKI